MNDIEKRNFTKDEFLQLIFDFTTKAVETIKNEKEVTINEVASQRKSNEIIGKCPVCGHAVIEGQKGLAVAIGKMAASLLFGKMISS